MFWTYTNRFTEANAGGGNNSVKISPAANTAMRIITLEVQMCDAAAGRATTIKHLDEDAAEIGRFASVSLDNQIARIPSPGASASAADNITGSTDVIIPGDGSCLEVLGTSLANTEYFDVRLCFELYGATIAPTVAHTSSGTASTGTASQNEVTVVPVFA